jgi:hypothetical protein
MAFFSNHCDPEPAHRPVNVTLSTELHSPNGILWLARLQTKLNSKEAELSDINRTLAATIDGASTIEEMKKAIKDLSQPERETVALCALLRSGAEARMERRESDLVRFGMLSEALEDYDIDLRAVALSQVVRGWPLRMDEEGQQNQDGVIRASNDFTTPNYEMFTDSSHGDIESKIGVVAWGMRACYLMHQCFEDEAKGQLAPLTPEAEAGCRRGLLTLIPTLPEETLSGVPLFGKELLGDVNSETLFGKFRDIVQARACFHLLQIGLTNDLQKIAKSGNENAPTPLEKYLKGELDRSGMIRQYLIPVINLSSDCRQELIDSLEGELVKSVVNPFNYTNRDAYSDFRFNWEDSEIEEALNCRVQVFASRLNNNKGDSSEAKIEEALERAGVDLALHKFFHQFLDGTIDDDSVVEVNNQWQQLSKLLHQQIGSDSIITLIASERALFQSFRVQLGIYLAEGQLHQHGNKFYKKLSDQLDDSLEDRPELRSPSTTDETNSTPAPSRILEEKAATRTNLLEHLAEKKPCPDIIITRAVSTLSETFPLFAPTSDEETAELEETISCLCREQLQERIDFQCTLLEEDINKKLGLNIC